MTLEQYLAELREKAEKATPDQYMPSRQELAALVAVAEAASGLTIGAAILAVLEDAGPAFTKNRMQLLALREALNAPRETARTR